MSDLEDFLKPYMVEDGDLLVLLDAGTIIPAKESKFGRSQFHVNVGLPDQRQKVWAANKTSRDRFTAKWGEDSENWVNKQVKIEKNRENVRGEMRDVLYGWPVEGEPAPSQQNLESASKADKIISLIVEKKNLTREAVESIIEDEIKGAAGLLTYEAAAYIVARNLEIDFEKSGEKVA